MYEELKLDIPKFWEFIAQIIANALKKVNESRDVNLKRRIFDALSRSFGEVTGDSLMKLEKSICDCLKSMVTSYYYFTICNLFIYLFEG